MTMTRTSSSSVATNPTIYDSSKRQYLVFIGNRFTHTTRQNSRTGMRPSAPPPFNDDQNRSSPSVAAEGKRIETEHTQSDDVLPVHVQGSSSSDNYVAADRDAATADVVVAGWMSLCGRACDMEDEICVRTNLCRLEINGLRPVHFFAVYDGHGGPQVALLCRENMHEFMEEELMRPVCTGSSASEAAACGGGGGEGGGGKQSQQGLPEVEQGLRRAVVRCFQRMDELALRAFCRCPVHPPCNCYLDGVISGSTAVVALLTDEHIVVANCGDSRAVLRRAGRAIPLSFDHKPSRPDEFARIEARGGQVINNDGLRVQGILAMSRAIGDKYLKQYITAEPEICFKTRDPQDEFLILASDGLWDVISSELACKVTSRCFQEGNSAHDTGDQSRSASAAALLTRLALARQSLDNISIIVVDLKRN